MSSIEQALFLDGSAHCVSAFDLSPDALLLTLQRWQLPEISVQARFARPQLVSTDDSHSADGPLLPWDIIGFDLEPQPDGGWRFCLHTDCVEYVFDAPWPQIFKFA